MTKRTLHEFTPETLSGGRGAAAGERPCRAAQTGEKSVCVSFCSGTFNVAGSMGRRPICRFESNSGQVSRGIPFVGLQAE